MGPWAPRWTQAGDILLAIDDVPLAEDGSIPFRDAERIGCPWAHGGSVIGAWEGWNCYFSLFASCN